MALIRGIWNVFRGAGLLAVMAAIITAVLIVSCIARLLTGAAWPDRPGRLRTET